MFRAPLSSSPPLTVTLVETGNVWTPLILKRSPLAAERLDEVNTMLLWLTDCSPEMTVEPPVPLHPPALNLAALR